MFKKALTILTAASLMAGTVIPGALAQSNFGRDNSAGPSYEGGYSDGYHRGWDDHRTKAQFNDRAPVGGFQPGYGPAPGVYGYGAPDPRANDDAGRRWQQQYQRQYTYQDDSYYRDCRGQSDPGGVIAGALIGGLLGNAIGRGGGRGGATIAGVVLGGGLGAALTRNMDCGDRSYAYNTYYNGFNAGRTDVPYQWRNPSNGHYGEFRVNDYSNDQGGFRCANFTQQIFINGRPQAASGRACQQPDGTWAVVG
jgi:surface antigen